MMFISDHIINTVGESNIVSGYRTDHNAVTLCLKTTDEPRGPGLWKFNDSLLQDEEYISAIKSIINETVAQYANPLYSTSFRSNHLNFGYIQFTISIKLFYETLLMLIRGETVRYSKRKARKHRELEQMAITNVDKIREQFALSGNESDAESLLLAQKHLENIRAPKIQGLIIRSRVRWHEEGEKCSKYFLSLERANGKRKSVQTLQENGKLVTNKKKIISMFSKQLSERYTADYSVTSSGVSFSNAM